MQSLNTTLKISLLKLLKSTWTYVCLVLAVLAVFVAMVLLPIMKNPRDLSKYFNYTWVVTSLQIIFVTWCLVGCAIGETNSVAQEKNYFLSKNINRSQYLLAKVLSSFIVTFIICLISSSIMLVMFLYIKANYHTNIFNIAPSVNAVPIFISLFVIIIFSSIVSTIWKFFFRFGVTLIAATGFLFLFAMLYEMFAPMRQSDNPDRFVYVLWWTILPSIFLPPIVIALSIWGWFKFKKLEVES